ncbi:MAG: dTDP-4-dehydrorhamnose reductase, partial [Verrucomicrobiales bacterium]|nr:dTDP-4-dehydrorhamnose reductase [Verrucomicrobiales bacterium]
SAQLVQTEDMGKATCTPALLRQAAFENDRRWLSLDLLFGMVDRPHPLWDYLLSSGITEKEILWFAEHPCPPDIIGINHYVTSNRHLDHRLELFPPSSHGGNGIELYADTESIRVDGQPTAKLDSILIEAWNRYGTPLAITECHLGCTREEQMRWLMHTWRMAQKAAGAGADIRAVTAWGLLGLHNWSTLLAGNDQQYEPGVFCLRDNHPQPTALARQVKSLALKGDYTHPLVNQAGWWERSNRIIYTDTVKSEEEPGEEVTGEPSEEPICLICDPEEPFAAALRTASKTRGIPICVVRIPDSPPDNRTEIEKMIATKNPWAMIYVTPFGSGGAWPDRTETSRNQTIADQLTSECRERDIPLLILAEALPSRALSRMNQHREPHKARKEPNEIAHSALDFLIDEGVDDSILNMDYHGRREVHHSYNLPSNECRSPQLISLIKD